MASNLSPYQLAIQAVVGKGKNALANLSTAQLGQIADQVFGPAPVKPGSTITYQDATTVRWTDAEGYLHEATRTLDGNDPAAGQWKENTNRPAVLPNPELNQITTAVGQNVQDYLSKPPTLEDLPQSVKDQLASMSAAEQASLAQSLQDQQGQLVAQLYGNRVNQSSIANDAAARFAQYSQLANLQQQANSANRYLGIEQFLAQMAQAQGQTAAGLYSNLSGEQLQTALANANINLAQQQLAQQQQQFNQNYLLNQQMVDYQTRSHPLQTAIQTIGALGQLAGGISGGLSAWGALTKAASKPASTGPTFGQDSTLPATPQATTYPTTTALVSPLGGYTDIYGNVHSIYA